MVHELDAVLLAHERWPAKYRAALTAAACGVLRAVARSGDVLAACDMLDALIKQQVTVDADTYTAVAMELVKAGEDERAAEVLDLRDYM